MGLVRSDANQSPFNETKCIIMKKLNILLISLVLQLSAMAQKNVLQS